MRSQGAPAKLLWPLGWLILVSFAVVLPAGIVADRSETFAYALVTFGVPGSILIVGALRHVLGGGDPIVDVIHAVHRHLRRENAVGLVVSYCTLSCTAAVWVLIALGLAGHTWAVAAAVAVGAMGVALNAGYLSAKDTGIRLKGPPPRPVLNEDEYTAFRQDVLHARLTHSPDDWDSVVRSLMSFDDVAYAGRLLGRIMEESDEEVLEATDELIDYIESSPFLRRALDAVRAAVDGSLYGEIGYEDVSRLLEAHIDRSRVREEWRATESTRGARLSVKWLVDLALGVVALVLCTVVFPIVPVTAILVRIDNRESRLPIVFKTVRIGRHGRPFDYYRFRIRVKSEDSGDSWISRWLLATGADKLPALYNVVLGDMSLVGPQPLSVYHYRRLARNPTQDRFVLRRLAVRPGFTGPCQLMALKSPEKRFHCEDYLRRDEEYVRTWSLRADVGILTRRSWAFLGSLISRKPALEDILPEPAAETLRQASLS